MVNFHYVVCSQHRILLLTKAVKKSVLFYLIQVLQNPTTGNEPQIKTYLQLLSRHVQLQFQFLFKGALCKHYCGIEFKLT